MKNLGINKYIFALIGLIFLTDLIILLNIPFLRQIFGFLFLTILPGLMILRILKLNKLGFTEKFVLSIGLSISFLMFFGLLINNLSLSLGYETPLATIPLLILFNIAFIVLVIIGYKINKNVVFSLPSLNLSTPEKAFLIIPVIFPALSVFGTYFMNTTSNNIISMFLLLLIPIYVLIVCFFNRKFPTRIYPFVIFLIGISLVLMKALRSNHILGIDAHSEYYFFQTTLNNAYWSGFGHSILDATLSISLLPTMYQLFLNLNPEIFFNVFYVILFSFFPLIIFLISKKYVGDFFGFLTSIFFISQHRFIFATGGARTNLALLFFALAMMTLFNDRIISSKKRILLILFMVSCVFSHYSTSYIFFFIMFGSFIGMAILSIKYKFKKNISLAIVSLFFAFIFLWYSQITEAAFNSGTMFIKNILVNLKRLFTLESRGGGISAMLGEGIMQKGIPHKVEFVLTWLMFAYIGIGVITLIRKHKQISFPEMVFKKPDFLRKKFEVTYAVIAIVCAGILAAPVAFPSVSIGYGIDRVFTQGITILSVFFVIGGIIIAKYLDKFFTIVRGKALKKSTSQVRAYVIILLVLIPYFLSVTGVTYQVFGYPRQITLNSEGEQAYLFVYDQEAYSAKWLGRHGEEKMGVYTDFYGKYRLISQASFLPNSIDRNSLLDRKEIKGYIYLRYCNVINGRLTGRSNGLFYDCDLTEYDGFFVGKDRIYNNGGSELYK